MIEWKLVGWKCKSNKNSEMVTGDSDIVSKDETTHGSDDASEENKGSEFAGISLLAIPDDKTTGGHFLKEIL